MQFYTNTRRGGPDSGNVPPPRSRLQRQDYPSKETSVELDVATVDPELINAGNQMFLFWRKPVATILASRSLAFNDVHYHSTASS
jgi:hypothetical protein